MPPLVQEEHKEEKRSEGHKQKKCESNSYKWCHTEVGAPAMQDYGSLVLGNMPRRPRTETSTLILGPVVTTLLRVYRITTGPTRGECRPTPTSADSLLLGLWKTLVQEIPYTVRIQCLLRSKYLNDKDISILQLTLLQLRKDGKNAYATRRKKHSPYRQSPTV